MSFFDRNDFITTWSYHSKLVSLRNENAYYESEVKRYTEDLNNLIKDSKFEIIAIIVVDIDQFKLVNEALGHDKGDLIIKLAAKRLENASCKCIIQSIDFHPYLL